MINAVPKVLPLALLGLLAIDISVADTWSSQDGPAAAAELKSVTAKASPAHAPAGLNSSAAQILFSDLEILKQEVQNLQEVIEQQGNELKKLKAEQKERYLDLDRRLSQAASKPAVQSISSTIDNGDKQYSVAYGLMKGQKLDPAVKAFKNFLQDYPKSRLVVNGYYWLGQIYYNQGKLDDARKAFTFVVNQFPSHQKAADSMYKLGVVLHRLGDVTKGKQYLKKVTKQFADSATARFASKYLQENYSN
ncbi:MAG: tol-pal system protein YbgF [Bermanella sp.]|jgi:tol-pal system protein YbgF